MGKQRFYPPRSIPLATGDFSGAMRPGRRSSQLSKDAVDGQLTGAVLEFITACDDAKRAAGRSLKLSEVFQIVLSLGYAKARPHEGDGPLACHSCGQAIMYDAKFGEVGGQWVCARCRAE